MRILTVTNMYPTERNPQFGIFVREQVDSIRRLGLDVEVLFVNGREGRLAQKGYLQGFPALWRALRARHYDVVHAHYVFSGVIARAQRSAPLVVTHHGVEVRDPIQGTLCRLTRSWADEQIVVARWMVEELGWPQAHVIPCGVDLELFRALPRAEARAQLGLDPNKRYVLFAGYTWDPVKRFSLVEQAVAILQSRCRDVELIAVCQQPHERIPLYMNACDVFAMTSVCEGSAQVVKEAMACNLPIVATDAGDNWDVIGDTEGCFRSRDTPAEIAANLEAAMSPPRRTDGRRRIEHFGLRSTAERVVSVYMAALGSKTASEPRAEALKAEVL